MRVERDTMPNLVEILILPQSDHIVKCIVNLADNDWHTEIKTDSNEEQHTTYIGSLYTLEMTYNDNLIDMINDNFAHYLNEAKNQELTRLFKALRMKRDKLLSNTDYLVFTDYPISETNKALVLAYRQALRDLPEVEGAPYEGDFQWPKLTLS